MWISVILAAGMFILVIGFFGVLSLWDRRKLKKLEKTEKQLERIEKLEKAIKAYARKKLALAEVLREAGLMLVLVLSLLSVAGWTSAAEAAVKDEEIIERLTRLETTVEKGFANLQIQIDNLQRQIGDVRSDVSDVRSDVSDVRSEVRWIGGILFAGMFAVLTGVVGFVLWDRRTLLVPAVRKSEELEERFEKRNEEIEKKAAQLEKAIKQYALKKEPGLAELLREGGLLLAAKV
ncbi:MAG: hypothetical protein QME81_05230 [bacterium]|nr:hypothetical protein [bacterium]